MKEIWQRYEKMIIGIVLLGMLVIAMTIYGIQTCTSDLSDFKNIADIIQSLLTSLAILVGGYWAYSKFIKKREGLPKATVAQKIDQKSLAFDKASILIHVTVIVSNIGDALLQLDSGFTRLYQIEPIDKDILESLEKGIDPVLPTESEIRWPKIGERGKNWNEEGGEIEPGETEIFESDFILPSSIKTVQVYSFIGDKLNIDREFGWQCSDLLNIKKEGGFVFNKALRQSASKTTHKGPEKLESRHPLQ